MTQSKATNNQNVSVKEQITVKMMMKKKLKSFFKLPKMMKVVRKQGNNKKVKGGPRPQETYSNIHPAYDVFMLWRKDQLLEERRLEKIAKAERERAYRAELYDRIPLQWPPVPDRVLTDDEKEEAKALRRKIRKERSEYYYKVRRLPYQQRPFHWAHEAREAPPPASFMPSPLPLTEAEQEARERAWRDLLDGL